MTCNMFVQYAYTYMQYVYTMIAIMQTAGDPDADAGEQQASK